MPTVAYVARQLGADPAALGTHYLRPQTRREQLAELMRRGGFRPFGRAEARAVTGWLTSVAGSRRVPVELATALVEELRRRRILLPTPGVLERVMHEARARAEQVVYRALTEGLDAVGATVLDALLVSEPGGGPSRLAWMRAAPTSPAARNLHGLLERLRAVRALGVERARRAAVPPAALDALAAEGLRMTVQHLRDLAPQRRTATLVAAALRLEEELTDAALETAMTEVAALARRGALPDATLDPEEGLRIAPVRTEVPPEVRGLAADASALLPRTRITDLLLEVDGWTGFSDRFVHARSGRPAEDRAALLTAILADGINLGLARMAESCRGPSLRQLAWTHDWHVREECYAAALARLIEAHRVLPLAAAWGDGTTSSSDGQFFRAGGRGEAVGDVNARHSNEPGVAFYTHVSDQFGPFHTKVIAATASEAPHVLDGLLRHGTGLRSAEHYTDTGGATDQVSGLFSLLGILGAVAGSVGMADGASGALTVLAQAARSIVLLDGG